MNDRTFGIEIECYGSKYYDPVDETFDLLRGKGFTWGTGYDDSVEDGVEIKSPVLIGEEGLKEVERVVSLLNSEDYYVTENCGLHVHHGAAEFINNKPLVKKFINTWMNNQEHIAALVDPERHSNDYSELWYDEDVDSFFCNWETWNEMGYSKRGAFNLGSLMSHQTIEIRLHEGTLDADEIIHWIRLGNSLVSHVANRGGVSKISDPIVFLERIGVQKNTIGYFSHRYKRG